MTKAKAFDRAVELLKMAEMNVSKGNIELSNGYTEIAKVYAILAKSGETTMVGYK